MNLRPLALLAIPFVCAACIGFTGDPTSPPATPGATPTSSPFDFSQFTPFPVLGPTPSACYDVESRGGPSVDIDIDASTGDGQILTSVVAARRLDGAPVAVPDTGEPIVQETRAIEGGLALHGRFIGDDDAAPSVRDIRLVASFSARGEAGSTSVPVTVDGSSFTMTFPSVDAAGLLAIAVDYRDDCYAFTATATASVQLGSHETVAGCPVQEADLDTYLRHAYDVQRAFFGSTTVATAVEGGEWLWLGGVFASDSGTRFGMWDQAIAPIHAAAGDNLVFHIEGGTGRLTRFMTQFFTRSDALHEFDRDISPVATREPTVRADGTALLRLPDVPGTYVTFTTFGWETSCLRAGSTANVEIVVP